MIPSPDDPDHPDPGTPAAPTDDPADPPDDDPPADAEEVLRAARPCWLNREQREVPS